LRRIDEARVVGSAAAGDDLAGGVEAPNDQRADLVELYRIAASAFPRFRRPVLDAEALVSGHARGRGFDVESQARRRVGKAPGQQQCEERDDQEACRVFHQAVPLIQGLTGFSNGTVGVN
jgi:hypothetical protein